MKDLLFDPDFLDQPIYIGERQYFVICSTPRTGSTLLCEILRENGIGVPMEYFHKRNHLAALYDRYVPDPDTKEFDLEYYIELLKTYRTSANGYFGFKVHWGQLKWLKRDCALDKQFPGLKFIYLTRKDNVAQAVSVSKAAYSKQWYSYQDAPESLTYDEKHIAFCLKTIRKSNARWQEWFEELELNPIHLTFEDLLSDPQYEMERVAQHLKIENRKIVTNLETMKIKSQSDSINRLWIEKFLESHPEQEANLNQDIP